VDDYISAFSREDLRDPAADSLPGPRYHRNLALEPHLPVLNESSLLDRPPAVDHQRVADDHIRKIAREKEDCAHEVLGLVPASPRDHLLRRPFFISRTLQNVLAR